MLKKSISVLLAVLMVVSVLTVGVVATGAATTDGFKPESTKLYFDVDGTGWTMGAKDKIAFYIAGGDFGTEDNPTEPVDWGGKKLQGTATTGETGIFEFDPVAKVGYKFTKDVQYKIIFARVSSNNWKEQTCSLFFTTDCFGHVAYSDGTEMENDVDSSKKSKTVYWRGIDPEENGPALCITSIGNVVGSCVEQGKTKYSLFEEFISEAKKDFGGKTGLENAIYYTVEQAKTKTEQKLIDDIGAALGLTKDDVAKAFTDNEITTAWTAADSALPAGQAAHTHTPGEAVQENVVPASCKAEGSYDEVVYCTECGEELSREAKTIDKLAHTPGDAVQENVVPASCKAEGSYDEVVYCTECQTEISRAQKKIDKLAHTPGEAVQENIVPATCTADGSYDEVVYCTECGEELSRETKTIKTEGHKIVFVDEVPATATKDGMKAHYECTECHKLFSDAMGTVEVTAESLVIKAEHLRGDANMDGVVDIYDVTTIQRVLAEMEVENYDPIAADTDLDGIVDMIDVTLLQRVDVGMTTFEAWDAAHKAA